MFLNYRLFRWITAVLPRRAPAMGKLGRGPWSKAFHQLPQDIFFLWLGDREQGFHPPTTNTCRLANTQILQAPHYQICFSFSNERSSMAVNFYQSVFLVLLLLAAAAETFLPLSSPPSPPLPKGNSMGSPLLRPHTATKTLVSWGRWSLCNRWVPTSATAVQTLSSSVRLYSNCLVFKRVCCGERLITVRLNEILSSKNISLCLITKWKEKIRTIFVLKSRHLKRLSASRG